MKFRPTSQSLILLSALPILMLLTPLSGEPSGFGWAQFDSAIKSLKSNHVEPALYDEVIGYAGAANQALMSLPKPVAIVPKSRYDKLKNTPNELPGKPVEFNPTKPYVLIRIDLSLAHQQQRISSRSRFEKMKPSERQAEAERIRQEAKVFKEQEDRAWKDAGFGRDDFKTVVSWVEANWGDLTEGSEEPFTWDHFTVLSISGFMSTLDPHCTAMSMDSWQTILKEADNVAGIGAMLRGGGEYDVTVENLIPESSGLSAGVKAGDVIRKVDGKPVDGLSLSAVVKMLRGKKDTMVSVEIFRATSATNPLQFKIKRTQPRYAPVSIEISRDAIALLTIRTFLFDKHRPSDVARKELKELQEKNKLKGLIIDLRDNPGGDLDESIRMAELFLPEGSTVTRIERKGNTEERKTEQPPVVEKNLPIMVLINAGSAGSSEILASALLDSRHALVVGENSFGSGTVQSLQPRGKVLLKITTARYFSGNGYSIQVRGVTPDISISSEPDPNSFPLRFREEDMWRHLPPLRERMPDNVRNAWIEKLKKEAQPNSGGAETRLKLKKDDAVRPDYMLERALVYFQALTKYPTP